MVTSRNVPGLRCLDCGERYDPGPSEPWRCTCGQPLELADDPLPKGQRTLQRARGVWAAAEYLSVDRRVSFGEGWTPLVGAPEWEASFKLEYLFPSGSFKDRGAAVMLSRAAGLDVRHVLADSSGNAGAAVAHYAARAGMAATIYVPKGVSPAKRDAIERTGVDVVQITGTRSDVAAACHRAVADGRGWYASHAWRPSFLEGTSTVALEIVAQRNWAPPDVVVVPAGNGTILLGAYRGFRRLKRAGWIETVPRLIAAQATGVAPLVDRLADSRTAGDRPARQSQSHDGEWDGTSVEPSQPPASVTPDGDRNELADGIQIREPPRLDQQVSAVKETGGTAVAVGASATRRALATLRRAGFSVEPTSAVAPAALSICRDAGVIDDDDAVVIPLTGSGHTDTA